MYGGSLSASAAISFFKGPNSLTSLHRKLLFLSVLLNPVKRCQMTNNSVSSRQLEGPQVTLHGHYKDTGDALSKQWHLDILYCRNTVTHKPTHTHTYPHRGTHIHTHTQTPPPHGCHLSARAQKDRGGFCHHKEARGAIGARSCTQVVPFPEAPGPNRPA